VWGAIETIGQKNVECGGKRSATPLFLALPPNF